MRVLVTGGAGFIGRWVVKALLGLGHEAVALDDLSNGRRRNLAELESHPGFGGLVAGSIGDPQVLAEIFDAGIGFCFHLAAKVVVQDSIDDPGTTFANDVAGTFLLLDTCRKAGVPIAFVSSCMVYDCAGSGQAIGETHPVKPASPYAACKLSAENLVLSYWRTYGLPATVIRPFNTFGPFQKGTGEGGVVSVFLLHELQGLDLNIYGDGTQTRDLLYVEDCARLIIGAGFCEAAHGRIVNGGTGTDVTINELAGTICPDPSRIKLVEHIHPQSEIQKLLCDSTLAGELFGWKPQVSLAEGVKRTREWLVQELAEVEPPAKPLLTYGRQWLNNDDIAAVASVLRSDRLTQGPNVGRFERAVAGYCGAKYAVAVANGTAALHTAYHAAGLGAGDEVITSPMTFAATANAVLFCGAKPVFADILPGTLCIDPEQVAAKITPGTKAVAPVDFAGHPCDYGRLRAIAQEHGLLLIEDACHALGATYRGKRLGGIADLTVFSFHPVKHITTGEGGMILTDREDLYTAMRDFRTHGITKDPAVMSRNPGPWYCEMTGLGWNYRLTDIQSALGSLQMRRLDAFVARRREIARLYDNLLADVPHVTPQGQAGYGESSYHLYAVRIDFAAAGIGRKDLFERLAAARILPQVHYIPVHLHPYYREHLGTGPGDHPVAEQYYEQALSLPMYPLLTDDDVRRVVQELRAILSEEI